MRLCEGAAPREFPPCGSCIPGLRLVGLYVAVVVSLPFPDGAPLFSYGFGKKSGLSGGVYIGGDEISAECDWTDGDLSRFGGCGGIKVSL